MKHKKLLFVVTEDWYFVSHRLQLAIEARKMGMDVAVATRVNQHGDAIRESGIRLIPMPLTRRGLNAPAEIIKLAVLYRREQPDIVHHVALKPVVFGTIAALLARVPAWINAVAGLGWLFSSAGGLARLIRPLFSRLLGACLSRGRSLTIVQNPDDAAVLVHAGVPAARLRLVLGAGVDIQAFHPDDERCLDRPVVMLASRMLWGKGVGVFVEAAALVHRINPLVRFVLVGTSDVDNPDSIPEAQLREWNGRNGVEWWGRREIMADVYRQATIACLPSSYGEGIPKTLLEAASCGLPIVTTNTPGCREVVSDLENGFLAPINDPGAIATFIARLVDDASLRRRMGAASRERAVKLFSSERIIAQTLQIYNEVG